MAIASESGEAARAWPGLAAANAIRPRVRLPIIEWGRRRFRLTKGPLVPAGAASVPWSPELDPLSVAPLEAMTDPRWSLIVEMGSPQASGKTTRVLLRLLFALDQERADFVYFCPSKELARDQWEAKIKPAMAADPELASLIPADREEQGVHFSRQFVCGGVKCMGYFRGADSRGALAGVSAPLVIADDVHAMSRFPEGDHPCDVARERSDALPATRKTHVLIGQAGRENDYLATRLFESAFFVPVAPCPACGVFQMIEWDRIEYAADDPSAARELAALRCAACAALIGQANQRAMLAKGVWVSMPPGENWITAPRPGGTMVDLKEVALYPETFRATTTAGFWRSALYFPHVPWGDQAVKFLEGKGSPEAMLNFRRRVRCVPERPPTEEMEGMAPAEIASHAAAACQWQVVHEAADLVLLTADCQAGYVYYVVRAWRQSDGASWLVECGSSKTEHRASGLPGGLELLGTKAAAGWKRADGKIVLPRRCAVDSGYEPDLVWRHCKRYGVGLWFPTKGVRDARTIWSATPNKVKHRLYWPVGVNEAKSVLWRILQAPAGGPGYHALPADMPTQTLDAYSRHMVSEVWDDRRRLWVKAKQRLAGLRGGRNDYWDCEVLQVAAALSAGVKVSAFDGPAIETPARMPALQAIHRGPPPLGGRRPIRRTYR